MRDDESTTEKHERIRRDHGDEYEEREDEPAPTDDPDEEDTPET